MYPKNGAFPFARCRSLVGLRRPRACGTTTLRATCVNVTRRNSLLARPNGSSAPATARQYDVRVSALPLCCSNCSASHSSRGVVCGHKQVDMLSLLLGRSRPGRRLVKVFSPASLVRIARDDTSQLLAAPAKRIARAWTYCMAFGAKWNNQRMHGKVTRSMRGSRLAPQLHIYGTQSATYASVRGLSWHTHN